MRAVYKQLRSVDAPITRDQKMRHLRNVADNRLTCDIFFDRECQPGRIFLKCLRLQQIAQQNHLLLVRNLDMTAALPGIGASIRMSPLPDLT